MKIVFLNTFDKTQDYQDSMPPLGLGYIASYAKKECWFLEPYYKRKIEDALALKPDMILISSVTETFNEAISMAQAIKKVSDIPVVLGGIHITSLPHTLPECFDLGCVGEGEELVSEIALLYYEKRATKENLSKIPGLCYHDNGKLVINQPRPFIKDLDVLPYPDRNFLGQDWLIPSKKQIHMITSRGCPYKCIFCASSLHWGKFRTFSAGYVIKELESLIDKYHPEEVYFFDDLFVGHIPRFREICRMIKERGLHNRTIFRSYARVDLMNKELADYFADLNFRYIDFGFESNSAKILDYYDKTHVTPEKNQAALDLLYERGISAGANFLLGAPIETEEDMDLSYRFCEKNIEKLDRLSVGPVLPLPGTQLWFEALKEGIVSENMDWSRFHLDVDNLAIDKLPYICKNVPKEKLLQIHNRFNKLARKINQKGEKKKLYQDLWRKEAEIQKLKSEIDTMKGSRLINTALKIRDIFQKK